MEGLIPLPPHNIHHLYPAPIPRKDRLPSCPGNNLQPKWKVHFSPRYSPTKRDGATLHSLAPSIFLTITPASNPAIKNRYL